MLTDDFSYDLPDEYIAQTAAEPRDSSRLMVLHRKTRQIEHRIFRDLGDYLQPKDVLVLNETRVIPARLFAHKIPSGGRVEVLLLKKQTGNAWEVLVGGKGLSTGKLLQIENGPQAEIEAVLEGAQRLVRFTEPIEPLLPSAGHVPLPPYIYSYQGDPERYQTVYSQTPGSAAAPTAGLHFTKSLLDNLTHKGIEPLKVTLHVGLDTFAPVDEDNPAEHRIHTEWCQVSPPTAEKIVQAHKQGGRIFAVGTTSVRTLETAAHQPGNPDSIAAYEGPTSLYILPGFQFKAVDAMITNFHLPRSTLIMLVSAFAGREFILEAYETAKREKYRFFSFGDAMLIL